MKPQDFECA